MLRQPPCAGNRTAESGGGATKCGEQRQVAARKRMRASATTSRSTAITVRPSKLKHTLEYAATGTNVEGKRDQQRLRRGARTRKPRQGAAARMAAAHAASAGACGSLSRRTEDNELLGNVQRPTSNAAEVYWASGASAGEQRRATRTRRNSRRSIGEIL